MEHEHTFLKEKYGLHKSPEVEKAAKKIERQTGKKLSTGTESAADIRIENYLNRLRGVIYPPQTEGHESFDRKIRNLEMLKRSLYDKFVVKPGEVPESYWESVKRRHREEGHGDIEIPDDLKQELAATFVREQEDSLDEWVDYLTSKDAKYPDDLKYWAIRSILKMGRYDKEKKKFTERYGGAVSPFPELNMEALALVFAAMEKKQKGEAPEFGYDIDDATKQQFISALDQRNFAKLYGLAIEEFNPIPDALLRITEGRWVKYPKGSDPAPLVASLKKRGTGWCIAGEPTARRYLRGSDGKGGNDLEIYYSLDENGNPVIPRVVIVSAQDRISEVRGVAKHENTDSYIHDVVQQKLAELPDRKSYEKKASDMKQLTAIAYKTKKNETLARADLVFLYELDAPIEHFGYRAKDPRIAEIRSRRNPEEDMPIVFECAPEQIARTPVEINENTKAYVGPMARTAPNPDTHEEELLPEYKNIFHKLEGVKHIYTSFPEGRIRIEKDFEVGPIRLAEFEKERERHNSSVTDESLKIRVSDYVKDMMQKIGTREHPALKEKEMFSLVRLKVHDLGFPKGKYPTTNEIYKRIEELGLELCPPETGPQYRIQYTNQPMGEWFRIGMKQIADRGGSPSIFGLGRRDDGLWLGSGWTGSGSEWGPGDGFVFRLRKLKNLKT